MAPGESALPSTLSAEVGREDAPGQRKEPPSSGKMPILPPPAARDVPSHVSPQGRVLVVDDDPDCRRALGRVLSQGGCDVDLRADGVDAIDAVRKGRYDAIVTDIDMPGLDGIELLRRIREHDADVPVVLVTGNPTLESAMAAIEFGARHLLPKPIDSARLRTVVADAVRKHRLVSAKQEVLDLVALGDPYLTDATQTPAAFGRALESLWIAYQPIVSWSRRGVYGYEALLRSTEPALPHPGAVIEAAERLDRLQELGRAVRNRAAAPNVPLPAGAALFVNLHPRDLLDEHLFDPEAPLTAMADRVVLEITERASLHHVRDVLARIRRLRELGFRIAVDDLGAGYSGLTAFAQLEPDVVKLDMSLVRGVHAQGTKLVLVRTMISMCRELGMSVVAEGIETAEERDAILDSGCELMQGYLFARPDAAFPRAAL